MSGLDRARRYQTSAALLERARKVIPSGVWGHNRFPAFLSHGNYPYFARSASGARFLDADGNEYIDYICGYGAMINGFANRTVDAAAHARTVAGDCLNQPTEVSIELAERLTQTLDGMSWCGFAKNGSDAVSTAVTIARAHTGRNKVVCAKGAYHGSHFWCNWSNPPAGRLASDSSEVLLVDWNDSAAMRATFERMGEEIAGVVLTPFHHPFQARAELPAEGYWQEVEAVCREWGALLIVDDVRTGFRLDMSGSHAYFGFAPDLVCLSKALANTHPLSSIVGTEGCRVAAEEIFVAGTYWGASAPMAAALANLEILSSGERFSEMWRLSDVLCKGLVERAAGVGLELEITGPSTMPTVMIAGDDSFDQMNRFAESMVELGSFVHPSHNWFFSAAHQAADVEETLEHAETAFTRIAGAARPVRDPVRSIRG